MSRHTYSLLGELLPKCLRKHGDFKLYHGSNGRIMNYLCKCGVVVQHEFTNYGFIEREIPQTEFDSNTLTSEGLESAFNKIKKHPRRTQPKHLFIEESDLETVSQITTQPPETHNK